MLIMMMVMVIKHTLPNVCIVLRAVLRLIVPLVIVPICAMEKLEVVGRYPFGPNWSRTTIIILILIMMMMKLIQKYVKTGVDDGVDETYCNVCLDSIPMPQTDVVDRNRNKIVVVSNGVQTLPIVVVTIGWW